MKNYKYSFFLTGLLIVATFSFSSAQTGTQGSGAMTNTAVPAAGANGTDHTFDGSGAGANSTTSSYSNSFLGYNAGNGNKDQHHNTYIGWKSGVVSGSIDVQSKANNNTFLGSLSGANNLEGGNNTFIGMDAGYTNVGGDGVGDANVYVGMSAGFYGTGSSNTMLGWYVGYYNTGSGNSFLSFRGF